MENRGALLVAGSLIVAFVFFTSYTHVSFAHTSKTFGNTTIEIGWLTEPPLASDLNTVTVQVNNESNGEQSPVLNALANLTISAKYGTISKPLDFQPSPTTDGGYEAKILPTRVGPYILVAQGDVKGQKVDGEFKIEDVESKSIFSFPDSSIDTTSPSNQNEQVQDAINKLSNDIQKGNDDLNMSRKEMTDIQESIGSLYRDSGISYLILLTALGIGIAGVVLAGYLFTILRFKKGLIEGS
ncbi:MAG: hypothetical protein QOA19_05025 [Nitrososphaeraceae archaeon]|nr:hypothetical protein [Nitrososphaeraceae archaeon]MDW0193587.1 hypothetical protein [Nitrososphaeraceae archaeon]MDW0220679.1 hypothetical protein [Nitrososphaeraceae archaeon]MDW0225983.1 hypothetical protein [Nitrososphaeraceae archaeon]MDW0235516.1 hypothetical protein [Nitrososphaeraceae archaeon]